MRSQLLAMHACFYLFVPVSTPHSISPCLNKLLFGSSSLCSKLVLQITLTNHFCSNKSDTQQQSQLAKTLCSSLGKLLVQTGLCLLYQIRAVALFHRSTQISYCYWGIYPLFYFLLVSFFNIHQYDDEQLLYYMCK